jgi:Tc toxin complex TcA C-terminal TcB-binding domain/Neuraminidase-like domain
MNRIVASIKLGDTGPQVADLQDALRLLLDRGVIRSLDPPNSPTVEELAKLAKRFAEEQAQSTYGKATQRLVQIVQLQQGLGDNLNGAVEDKTADVLNQWLKELGALDEEASTDLWVRGQVTSAGRAVTNMLVVAFDKDLRKEQRLGAANTDTQGRYQIPYQRDKTARGELGSTDLLVRVYHDDPESKPLAESYLLMNVGDDVTVDLVLPAAQISEWEQIRDAVLPLLEGQGEGDNALPVWELNDTDLDFVVEETKLDRERVRLWVLAAKRANESPFLAPETPDSNGLRTNMVRNHKLSAPDTELEWQVFYGWFRAGQPNDLQALFAQPEATLRNVLDDALRDNHIPTRSPDSIERILDAWGLSRASDALHPAPPASAASIGDLLRTIPDTESLSRDESITFARLRATHGNGDALWEKAKEQGLSRAVPALRRTMALDKLTVGNPSLMAALQPLRNQEQPDSVAYLAKLAPRDWIDLGVEHGPPPDSDMPVGTYIENLRKDVEQQFPMQVLRAHLQREPGAAAGLPSSKIAEFLETHDSFNLKVQHVEPFLAAHGVKDEDLRKGLLKAQRLLAVGATAQELGLLAAAQFGSASQIVDAGPRIFIAAVAPQILEERAQELFAAASDLNSTSMAMAGQLTMNNTRANSIATMAVPNPSREILDQYPSLRTLFGDLDYCECRHCQSVLGPSAYLTDLMHFLQRSPLSRRRGGELLPANFEHPNPYLEYAAGGSVLGALLQRRPDLADLELSCENTNTEIPYIDLVLEILENAVALPMTLGTDVPPLAGTDIDTEFRAGNVPPSIVEVLQRTDIEVGGNLTVTAVPHLRFSPLFINDWIIKDGSRRWWIRHQQRRLILGADGQAVPIANVQDAVNALSHGNLSNEIVTNLERGLLLDGTPIILEKPSLAVARIWTITYIRGIAIKITIPPGERNGVIEWFTLGGGRLRSQRVSSRVANQIPQAFQADVTGPLDARIARILDLPANEEYSQTWNEVEQWWELRVTKTAAAVLPFGRLILAGLSYQNSALAERLTGTPENRNPAAYNILAGAAAVFPWALPFDLPLQELRAFLDVLGTSRSVLIDIAHPQERLILPAAVHELLGLSKTEADLIVDAPTSMEPWKFWGLKEGDNKVKDVIAGLDRSGPWPTILERLSLLLQQSGLNYREYLNYLQTQFAGSPVPRRVPPNECKTSVIELKGLSPTEFANHLSRLHSFTRLQRRTGWNCRELDLLIAAFGRQLTADTLQDLALVKRLQQQTDMSVVILAACIDQIDTQAWQENTREGEPVEPSPYDSIFQRPTLRHFAEFAEFASDRVDNTLTLTGYLDFLAAALGVKSADITLWMSGSPNLGITNTRNRDNVSRLFAAASLCHACGIKPASLPAVVELLGPAADPFRNLPVATPQVDQVRARAHAILEFAERVRYVHESGLTFDTLGYLLRHQHPAGDIARHTATVEKQVTQILSGLRAVLRAGSLLGDVSLENLRRQLIVRGWYASLIESLTGAEGLGSPLSASIEITPPLLSTPTIPLDLRPKIEYRNIDDTSAILRCTGSLYTADFVGLSPAIPVTRVADLQTLYENRRIERTQSLANLLQVLASNALPKSAVAVSLIGQTLSPTIPDAFRDRLQFEVTTADAGQLTLTGWLTDADRQKVTAASPLLGQALTALQTSANNQLPATTPASLQAADRIMRESDPQAQYAAVLLRLVPIVEVETIATTLSTGLGIDVDMTRSLLENVTVLGRSAMEILTDARYLTVSLVQEIKRTELEIQFNLVELLQKIAVIVNSLKITAPQMTSILFGSFDVLDVRTLPVRNGDAPVSFDSWPSLADLARLQDVLPNGPTAILAINTALESADYAALRAALAGFLEVAVGEVDTACAADLLGFSGAGQTSDYRRPRRLLQLVQLLHVAKQLGIPVATVTQLITVAPDESTARIARSVFESNIELAALGERLRPISDRLRTQQRDALVAYLVQRDGLQDASDLFERYLIDVEMGSCMRTSRLKQAISSVQLFVQRCILNLERPKTANDVGVSPDAIETTRWTWMKLYRVWEANRKVFLYPENWIEPELRDDKSEIFRAFESDLLQSEITHDTALVAFRKYLDKLGDVASLTVVSMFEEQVEGGTVVHVVGRDNSEPYKHYYRQWKLRSAVDFGIWTAWEEITAQLDSEHVMVFLFGDSVYLAWPTISPGQSGNLKWKIGMNLAKRSASSWTKLKRGRGDIEIPMVPTTTQRMRDARTSLAFRINYKPDNNVSIEAYGPPPQESGVTPRETKKELVSEFFSDDNERNAGPGVSSPVINLNLRMLESYTYEYAGKVKQTHHRPATGVTIILQAAFSTIEPKNADLIGGWQSPVPRISWRTENSHEFVYNDLLGTFIKLAPVSWKNLSNVTFNSVQTLVSSVKITVSVWREGARLHETKVTIPKGNSLNWQEDFILSQSTDPGWLPTKFQFLFPREGSNQTVAAGVPNLLRAGSFALKDDDSLELERYNSLLTLEDLLTGTEYFKSGYRDVGIDPNALALENRLVLSKTPGQFFVIRAQSNGQSTNSIWSYRDDLSSLLFWRNNAQAKYRLVPFSTGGLAELKAKVTKSRLLDAVALPGSLTPRLLDVDTGIDYDPSTSPDFAYSSSVTQIGIDFKKVPSSIYNWEVFFHNLLLVATQLSHAQRFEEAQRWFHLIFDPTTSESGPDAVRCWRFQPFRDAAKGEPIEELLTQLAQGKLDLSEQITEWALNPFRPHLVARQRIRAYQLTVVFKYLTNLIAWGDQHFRRDTIESINDATQLYVLASNILGRRPASSPRSSVRPRSYRDIQANLDDFSNAWLPLEAIVATQSGGGGMSVAYVRNRRTETEALNSLGSLYFCIPRNDKLDEHWDTVENRLFNIRHCRNIDGIERKLPLFEPPIDPALLVRATAAGLDLATVLSGLDAPLPLYRFNVMLQKALELCAEVRALGNALLNALEKKDAEQLSLLRSGHELEMLKLVRAIKEQQKEEAKTNLEALRKTREITAQRYVNYQRWMGKQNVVVPAEGSAAMQESSMLQLSPPSAGNSDTEGLALISAEKGHMDRLNEANNFSLVAGVHSVLAGILHMIPDQTLGATLPVTSVAKFGGSHIGSGVSAAGAAWSMLATNASFQAGSSATVGGYQRRYDEWRFQSNTAAKELEQIDRQILANEIRKQIAEAEITNHDKQIANALEVDEFMRDKFSNQQLYSWMVGQISKVYFRTFQLAYDLAKQAERTYRFELGLKDSGFIEFGYWDSLKKGLLSGERLYFDLKRMDAAYLDKNKREYEIAKHVSLMQLSPMALLQLKNSGKCEVKIPEALLDMDFPGHYLRRIKSVSLTIPCVTGPYASVPCTLTLLNHSMRHSSNASATYARDPENDDPRFTDSFGAIQSIVTSNAQNDSGMFETNLRDERYLPFEGAGAISNWRLKLPHDFRQFNYDTISDVILHIRYTAREGGELLNTNAVKNINDLIKNAEAAGSVRLFSVRHEFPTEWAQFQSQTPSANPRFELALKLRAEHYPFWSQGRLNNVNSVEVLAHSTQATLQIFDNMNDDTVLGTLKRNTPPPSNLPRGLLAEGTLAKPDGELKLYFETKAISDLWIAVAWKS